MASLNQNESNREAWIPCGNPVNAHHNRQCDPDHRLSSLFRLGSGRQQGSLNSMKKSLHQTAFSILIILFCNNAILADQKKPAKINPAEFNKRIEVVTKCFTHRAFGNQKKPPSYPDCHTPDDLYKKYPKIIRKANKELTRQGASFEIHINNPAGWIPILRRHDGPHILIDWLPELGCFYGHVQYYSEDGEYFLLSLEDGQFIKLGQGRPILSPGAKWFASAGINPYENGSQLNLFSLKDGKLNPKPLFPSRKLLRNYLCSSDLIWNKENGLSIKCKTDDVEFSKILKIDKSGFSFGFEPETIVGTRKPAVTIRTAANKQSKILAIVPFATPLEVVGHKNNWTEVIYSNNKKGFVLNSLIDVLTNKGIFGPQIEFNKTQKLWLTIQNQISPTPSRAKQARDAIEILAYNESQQIHPNMQHWFYQAAFKGIGNLAPVYDKTPNHLLLSSPAFIKWFTVIRQEQLANISAPDKNFPKCPCRMRLNWKQILQVSFSKLLSISEYGIENIDWQGAYAVQELVRHLGRDVFHQVFVKESNALISDEQLPRLYAWAMSNFKPLFTTMTHTRRIKYLTVLKAAHKYITNIDIKKEKKHLQTLKAQGRESDFLRIRPDGDAGPLRYIECFLFRRIQQGVPRDKLEQLLVWTLKDLQPLLKD
jgi:hypothetical protein